jgi:Fe-S-cluster containining protein
MSKPAYRLRFVDFKNICSECTVNCCKRLYAVLLPEEEEDFKEASFEVKTDKGVVKCIGSYGGKPCPFLNDQGYCTIYEKRPFDCRLWPVVIYIDFKTRDKVVYLDLDCPAVKNGKISIDLINKIIDSIKDYELDEKWLEKYTLAPWANNFTEIHRFKQVKSS